MNWSNVISDDEIAAAFPGLTDAPVVVGDHRIVNDPTGELPQSARRRVPANIDAAGLEKMVDDAVAQGADPQEVLDNLANSVERLRRRWGISQFSIRTPAYIRRMGIDGLDFDVPIDEADVDRKGHSGEPTLQLMGDVLKKLDKTGAAKSAVTAEARSLLKTIASNMALAHERQQSGNAIGRDDYDATAVDAYKEASPAFAAMGLSSRERAEEAQSERIVNAMFAKKFYKPSK